MTAPPVLLTDRFELWRPAATDLPDLCRLLENEATRRYLGPADSSSKAQFERLMRNAGSWALHGYGTFAVRKKGEPDIIATGGVFHSWRGFGPDLGMDDIAEAGWIVRADWCGQAVASEMMAAALAWFDEAYGPRRVACMIEAGNSASERLAARLGFVRYATHETKDGDESTTLNLYERVPS